MSTDRDLVAVAAQAIHKLTCRAAELNAVCAGATGHDFDLAYAALTAAGPTLPAPQAADGVSLIAAERARQVTAEGYTPERDAGHTRGYLARAAAVYAIRSVWPDDPLQHAQAYWPFGWTFKPASRVRMLTKAGALIAAEIDRLIAAGEGGTDGD